MQVFVRSILNEEGIKEWGIVELQGDLDSREEGSLAGKFVGDLFYSKDGIPTFIIGHHVLVGRVEKLEKPLAILEKRIDNRSNKTNPNNSEFVVRAVIKRKLCFRDRPKPIVGSASAMLPKSKA